ncbi:MAG: hypothetical protein AAFV51_02890 [Pseudomonadota bacterium]
MRFDSRDNLQVSGVRQSPDGRFFFRAFAKSEVNTTITDVTYIISGDEDDFEVLREIDDEITGIEFLSDGTFVAVGAFGSVYLFSGGSWIDFDIGPVEKEVLGRTVAQGNAVFTIGTARRFIKFSGRAWEPVNRRFGDDEDVDLYGLCAGREGAFLVCGEGGNLWEVSTETVRIHTPPTNVDLNNVAVLPDGLIAICGTQGVFMVGADDKWRDLSQPELNADFTSVSTWRGAVFVSANRSIWRLSEAGLETFAEIPSFNLIALRDTLWSVGVNELHRYDGSAWREVRITI